MDMYEYEPDVFNFDQRRRYHTLCFICKTLAYLFGLGLVIGAEITSLMSSKSTSETMEKVL